ncbi:hypothetical protein AB0E44_09195 [Micrococcus terreus]|uniref:hypothetical protein n=1 Tax=Micrococcus terreus TaxID=574650 RepID=UPI0033F8A96B
MTTTALDRAPMALTGDFEVYRDTALEWMAAQTDAYTADELREHVAPARPAWPGEVFQIASRSGLIALEGRIRRSTHPANKGTLRPLWITVTPTTTEADCA